MNFNLKNVFQRIEPYIKKIPLQYSPILSEKYKAEIYLKREDLQNTRSFKIRGSLNKILLAHQKNPNLEVVCASAGNHAQGVAFASHLLNIKSHIFVPSITPLQKQNRILYYGKDNIELKLEGENFNECLSQALEFSTQNNFSFIHPYDDLDIIQGQATIGYEILQEMEPDIVIGCVGGGGLISGLGLSLPSSCKIIGCEPKGADSLYQSLQQGKVVKLDQIDNFVDGASVGQVGKETFKICEKIFTELDNLKIISNGHICHQLLNLYQDEGIVLEPAGALSICGLDKLERSEIHGKKIVCVLSGGNNDVTRYPEILEKNLIYLDKKHYYIVQFTQKPKQLKKFIREVLGIDDDITRFEYIKKTNKSFGNVLIGLETDNYQQLEENMNQSNFKFQKINEEDLIYSYLV